MGLFAGHLKVLQLKDILSLANAFSGALAIVLAMGREGNLGALLIGLGIVFDVLDGLVARGALRGRATANDFGRELDSLADAITFGVAPVALVVAPFVYGVSLNITGGLAVVTLASALFYLACILTRLALFNLQPDKSHFEGLPSTAAAIIAVAAGLFAREWAWLALLAAGALAASRYRVPKPKLG